VVDKEYNCRLMAMPVINQLFFERSVYYYNALARIDSAILLLEATSPQGFREFCCQLGIDGEGALKTIGVEFCCVDIERYLSSDVESAPKDIDQARVMFLEYWIL
jgi:hypothetical protein